MPTQEPEIKSNLSHDLYSKKSLIQMSVIQIFTVRASKLAIFIKIFKVFTTLTRPENKKSTASAFPVPCPNPNPTNP